MTIRSSPSQLKALSESLNIFRLFDGIDRIKVDIIEPDVSQEDQLPQKRRASSPARVLDKVKAYIAENQLDERNGDSLWCVIDVDRWPIEQIEELQDFCAQKNNRHLLISNPSIEIWLLYHKVPNLSRFNIKTAKDAKQALNAIEQGGYYYIKYLPLMLQAIQNAKNADSSPQAYMPSLLQTKVYKLAQALYQRKGQVRFEKFIDSLPTIEQNILKKRRK